MGNTNIDWVQMSDTAIVKQIGDYIKHTRLQQNIKQSQLAEKSGLNRWTISQIEKGESITLSSLIQILRALDLLYIMNAFEVKDTISPLAYAKLKKQQKLRAGNKNNNSPDKEDSEW
ncbi:MAG: helix-turn-helix domain-containing protein [Bacteroidales bacterium]